MIKIQNFQPIYRCSPQFFEGKRCYVLEKKKKFLFFEWWSKYQYWFPKQNAVFETIEEATDAIEFLSKKFYFSIEQ